VAGVDDISRGQHQKFCHQCGATIHERAEICPRCGVRQAMFSGDGGYGDSELDGCGGKKIAAGILGILLGALGIHKFVLGLTTPGIIMLLVSIVSAPCFGSGAIVMGIIGLIEGIIYLCTPDRQFYQKYIVRKQGWF
jgi:TM2 domain-containing membrane protein YozV